MNWLQKLFLKSFDDLRKNEPEVGGPTAAKRGGLRHRGFTKPPHNAAKAKARRKMADKSRKINRK